MELFGWILALMTGAVLLAALARRIGVPYPVLLAIGGAALAFVPGAPVIEIEPELGLALFIAPVLLDAAYDASPRDLRDNWLPVATLTLVAVGLTTVGVAWTAKQFVPELPWAAAVALGAAVAPPDAAAATAVLRQLRPPHRILVILEGESLFNDASSLIIYRLAVAAALTGSFDPASVLPTAAVTALGGVALGYAWAFIFTRLTRRIEDAPTAIVLQFSATFGVWILAEELHVSAILAVVAYGITIGQSAPREVAARLRVPSYAVWETVVFVLNALAFTLIGLQLRPILERLSPAEQTEYAAVAFAVLSATILIRFGWVMIYNTAVRLKNRRFGARLPRPMTLPSLGGGLVIGWSGMRGIVTLAAVYALPENFPFRDLIVLCAFAVVLGTLLIHGLTLKPLMLWLGLRDDGSVEREVRLARVATAEAGLRSLAAEASPEAAVLRAELEERLQAAQGSDDGRGTLGLDPLRLRVVAAQRGKLHELRRAQAIGDDAFHRLEEELDRAELALAGPL